MPTPPNHLPPSHYTAVWQDTPKTELASSSFQGFVLWCEWVVCGAHWVCMRRKRLAKKKPLKTELASSVCGCVLSNCSVVWWGEVVGGVGNVVVWCTCTFEHAQGGRPRPKKNLKTSHYGLFWVDPDCGWGWGYMCYRAPCCCTLMGGELGVSWYGGRWLLCFILDLHFFLHLHLLPTLSLSSPSALCSS